MKPRTILLGAVIYLLAMAPLFASTTAPKAETEEQKTLYMLGIMVSANLSTFAFTPDEVALIQSGLSDGLLGADPKVEAEVYGPMIQPMLQARAAASMEKERTAGTAFLAEAEKESGAVKTETGLIYVEMTAGSGASPAATDNVRVHYVGKLRDGKVFDSSRVKNEPADFELGRVAPCFGEGLQKMKVGGTSKLVCPPALAYGDRGVPGRIPPGAVLVFEVELLEILPPTPAAPAAPAAPATPGQ